MGLGSCRRSNGVWGETRPPERDDQGGLPAGAAPALLRAQDAEHSEKVRKRLLLPKPLFQVPQLCLKFFKDLAHMVLAVFVVVAVR